MIRQIYSLGFPGLCQRKLEDTRLYGPLYDDGDDGDAGTRSLRNEILVCLSRLTIISLLLRNLHMFIKTSATNEVPLFSLFKRDCFIVVLRLELFSQIFIFKFNFRLYD